MNCTMRTRRSRFFWILLCVLGEQTPQSGIVAVSPRSLALSKVDLAPNVVVWLQHQGDCLGMDGKTLYECGDTTLFYMVQQKEDNDQFELRVVDHHSMEGDDTMTRRERRIRRRTEECLSMSGDDDDDALTVGPCHGDRKWWWKLWQQNRNKMASTSWALNQKGQLVNRSGRCIGANGKEASMLECNDDHAIVWTFLKAEPQEEDSNAATATTEEPKKKAVVEPAMFPELKVQSNLLFPPRKPDSSPSLQRPNLSVRVLTHASPNLIAHQSRTNASPPNHNHNAPVSKIQRIQTHPYLNAAQHDIWTDPSTSLEFRTDLQDYLGYDNGRHTLTGVGIYRKYVIKVYGVAFYVSKRSLLDESALIPYSGLSADELRQRNDFYQLLRSPELHVDRTLLIKTNMQLSAETMRNSLQADWSYLTADAKKLLAETGMRKLPADENMLNTISDDTANPSRCSCMQTAAPEYGANEECCARGTELAFTWTQGNALEVCHDR